MEMREEAPTKMSRKKRVVGKRKKVVTSVVEINVAVAVGRMRQAVTTAVCTA